MILNDSEARRMNQLFGLIYDAYNEIEDLRPADGFNGNPTESYNIESLLNKLAEQAKESREWEDKHERAACALGLVCRDIYAVKLQLGCNTEPIEDLINYYELKAIEHI